MLTLHAHCIALMPGSQFHDMKCFLIPPPPLRTGDQKKTLELLPMAHLKWFSDSVIPKSFTRLYLAFAMNCRDVGFLFCLMCLSHTERVISILSCGSSEILTHAFDLN